MSRLAMHDRVDLIAGTAAAFGHCLDIACRLGAEDEAAGAPERTGRELGVALATATRIGHDRALRAAYAAGRFHARTHGTPAPRAAR